VSPKVLPHAILLADGSAYFIARSGDLGCDESGGTGYVCSRLEGHLGEHVACCYIGRPISVEDRWDDKGPLPRSGIVEVA
jgi:hypothetical protein